MSIPGTAAGTAQIAVFDNTGNSVTINVTVTASAATPLNVIAPSSVSVALNGSETYAITGGRQPYTVVSSNTSVTNATRSGNTAVSIPGTGMGAAYYIGGGSLTYSQPTTSDVRYVTTTATGTNNSILNIRGVAAGSANVVVTDAVGKAVIIAVTVY